jgi:hypothetical protein
MWCPVFPALLPASGGSWIIICQHRAICTAMSLQTTYLIWESHPHAKWNMLSLWTKQSPCSVVTKGEPSQQKHNVFSTCLLHLRGSAFLLNGNEAANEKADSTLRYSQAVPDPSTNRALSRLTSEVKRDPVHSTRYGRQRKAYDTCTSMLLVCPPGHQCMHRDTPTKFSFALLCW